MNRGVIFYAVLGVSLSSLPAFGRVGVIVYRPVAELELMDDAELAQEAYWPCLELTSHNSLESKVADLPDHPLVSEYKQEKLRETVEDLRYLDTISLVARKKNGGDMPAWVIEMQEASRGTDGKACGEIMRKARNQYYDERMRQAIERDKKRAAEKAKQQKVEKLAD